MVELFSNGNGVGNGMNLVLYILFLHWVADFVCQSRWMGENKSKHILPLLAHIVVYGVVLLLGLFVGNIVQQFSSPFDIMVFCAINAIMHLAVDFWTSKATHVLWERKNVYGFFTVIGFDQFLHSVCLIVSANIIWGV